MLGYQKQLCFRYLSGDLEMLFLSWEKVYFRAGYLFKILICVWCITNVLGQTLDTNFLSQAYKNQSNIYSSDQREIM